MDTFLITLFGTPAVIVWVLFSYVFSPPQGAKPDYNNSYEIEEEEE